MDSDRDRDACGPSRPFEPEWGNFINEVRTALPGVQLLFAFLLTVPFTQRFEELGDLDRVMFLVCFLLTTAACAFLIAPSVYHRLHWRREVDDKEEMFATCNVLAIVGGSLLAMAMTAAVFVVSHFLLHGVYASVAAAVAALLFSILWYWLPLSRRRKERKQRTEGPEE